MSPTTSAHKDVDARNVLAPRSLGRAPEDRSVKSAVVHTLSPSQEKRFGPDVAGARPLLKLTDQRREYIGGLAVRFLRRAQSERPGKSAGGHTRAYPARIKDAAIDHAEQLVSGGTPRHKLASTVWRYLQTRRKFFVGYSTVRTWLRNWLNAGGGPT